MTAAVATAARCWRGELRLRFARDTDGTRLVESRARMPLALQRPFYPEGPGVCHAIMLHPPGGMVSGDELTIDVALGEGSRALLTTPAAAKWYRSDGAVARQHTTLRVASGAISEWLPQETIVFDGARVEQQTRVELADGAYWLGWEVTRFGRSARGERFESGEWRAHTEVWRDRQPLWIDRQRLTGGDPLLGGAYGLAGQPVIATFAWVGAEARVELVEAARAAWHAQPRTGQAGASRLRHGLVCRYRGPSSAEARQWLVAVWDLVRREAFGQGACPPRIWST
jgi:urease accessory protein